MLYRAVSLFVSLFASALVIPFRFVRAAEGGRFERLMMRVFRYRDITKTVDGQKSLYLRRFFLTPRTWPVRIFLHHIVRSDDDRVIHTHPWDFVSTILRGSYLEQLANDPDPLDYRLAVPGSVLDNPAEHQHRVEIIEPVWSLVVLERARRMWGFVLEDGREVPWREYLKEPDAADSPEDVIVRRAA